MERQRGGWTYAGVQVHMNIGDVYDLVGESGRTDEGRRTIVKRAFVGNRRDQGDVERDNGLQFRVVWQSTETLRRYGQYTVQDGWSWSGIH